ncbi:hypothetical protein BDW59DRAFT_50 [Aspergillus cavernicola]|uniref:Uncharacterized protein n=1 Tax=Aspergillus cavernicola TaxID=176166 RepID=A0ABR4J4D2_9EURO
MPKYFRPEDRPDTRAIIGFHCPLTWIHERVRSWACIRRDECGLSGPCARSS